MVPAFELFKVIFVSFAHCSVREICFEWVCYAGRGTPNVSSLLLFSTTGKTDTSANVSSRSSPGIFDWSILTVTISVSQLVPL